MTLLVVSLTHVYSEAHWPTPHAYPFFLLVIVDIFSFLSFALYLGMSSFSANTEELSLFYHQ